MLASIRGPLSDQRLPAVLRGARSGNRALRLRAPAYEHPQRYLILGKPATRQQSARRRPRGGHQMWEEVP